MSHRRQFALWIALAAIAVVGFFAILRAQYQPTQQRFALAVAPHPAAGRELFQTKGCATCHGTDGDGGSGPPLRENASLRSLPRLVTAVWNHVPRMSDAIAERRMSYPAMSNEDMAQLFAYLYIVGVTDRPGDIPRGRQYFETNGCASCHGAASSNAPSIAEIGRADSPLALTEAMWNHASRMKTELQRQHKPWPAMKAGDLRDVFAYIHSSAGDGTAPSRPGDPARGWQAFQAKGCTDCHNLAGRPGATQLRKASATMSARPLGTETLPATVSQFGEAMLNHLPDMERGFSLTRRSAPWFDPGEFTDIAVFLYSLRYTEPTGSPHVGASVFQWRGCSSCHGNDGVGGSAPPLRGRGQNYTAVRLATGLWRHGSKMYVMTQRNRQPWPELQESDIGDLLAFLNTPLETSH